ncbi:protein takeout-like isoform X2 [Odontomachus brunneus]|uniref:protein takeout-like isoform X2 n=1 Tax=Odontomachus brunneus TaxID=486640 RepID=UPI0013F28DF9|nr:protein takeout-like isoform X2 [Odontomachus brunneus]
MMKKITVSFLLVFAITALELRNRELKFLPFDPLNVDFISMKNGGALSHEFHNLTIHGLSKNVQISVKNFNKDTLSLDMEAFFPQTEVIGNYTISGRILLLPIHGRGKCKIILSNMTVEFKIKNEIYDKNGEEYLRYKKIDCHIKQIDIKSHFENLLGGDPKLGKEVNKLINDNSKELFNDFRSAYEKIYKEIISRAINNIFKKIPLKKLFPYE